MSRELNFPIILLNDKGKAYGGNQEWFDKNWQRRAGFGCTAGTNLAAYYASADLNMVKLYEGNYNQREYVKAMNEMFTYMRPDVIGYPYINRFSKQFIKYAKERGINMEASILKKARSTKDAFTFVKDQINAGQPIALLILSHRAKQLSEHNWHWVTITGYIEASDNNKSQIILSNYGKREIQDAEVLLEAHSRNRIRMVSFRKIAN